MLKLNTIHHGDCLELMKEIPDQSIDMILTDPPYGLTDSQWDKALPFSQMWNILERIIKPNGVIALFCIQPFASELIISNKKLFRYEWIWHKSSGSGFANAKFQPLRYHECIAIFYKKKPIYNPIFEEYAESVKKRFKEGESVNIKNSTHLSTLYNNISKNDHKISFKRGRYPTSIKFFKSIPNANGKRLHPTQKPIDLLEYFINTYTNTNDLILDFTIGSGSTAIAAINTNRQFIGIEKELKYVEVANERIKNHVKFGAFF